MTETVVIDEMNTIDTADQEENDIPVLKLIFDRHAEETISDEQIQRVLEPVRQRIQAGEYRTKRPDRLHRLTVTLMQIAAAIVLVVLATSVIKAQIDKRSTDIPAVSTPLTEAISDKCTLTGRVTIKGSGAGGVKLTLLVSDSMETSETTVTLNDGTYSICDVENGIYYLIAELSSATETSRIINAGTLEISNGNVMLVRGGDSEIVIDNHEVHLLLD